MEKKMAVVCGTVGFLGLLSAALGFAAEATRIRASDVMIRTPRKCIYPRSPALYLGLVSAATVAIAQAGINFFAGCICCKRNPNRSNTNSIVALISFTVSWVTFIIAFLLLLSGSAFNNQKGMQKMYMGHYCYVMKHGVFSGGAVLSLVSISLGIIYYVTVQAPKSLQPWGAPPHNQINTLARPDIASMSSQPVFVDEDTYRRQYL